MNRATLQAAALTLAAAALAAGCQTPTAYDYTEFRAAQPKSILVLPPVNDSTAVDASYSVYSLMTYPLAESGYYVFPVTLVDETFRQNGLTTPNDIQSVAVSKLHEIFGADAGLYVKIKEYGTVYQVISSASIVTAEGTLIDLRTGKTLWEGKATASSAENQSSNGGGIVGLLVQALVTQIVESSTDTSHNVAAVTSARLLGAGRFNGMLYGPRSPNYQKDR